MAFPLLYDRSAVTAEQRSKLKSLLMFIRSQTFHGDLLCIFYSLVPCAVVYSVQQSQLLFFFNSREHRFPFRHSMSSYQNTNTDRNLFFILIKYIYHAHLPGILVLYFQCLLWFPFVWDVSLCSSLMEHTFYCSNDYYWNRLRHRHPTSNCYMSGFLVLYSRYTVSY